VSGPGSPPLADHGQTAEVVVPAVGVIRDGVVGQPAVHEAHEGLGAFGVQRDLHLGRAGVIGLPGWSHPKVNRTFSFGDDLDELADAEVGAGREDAVHAARSGVDLALGALSTAASPPSS
jgi:hypothetical protein